MKLVNLLGTTALAALFAAGCSSTTTTTTDAATDTYVPPSDTPAETVAEAGDTAEAGQTCGDCTTANCKTEFTTCDGDATCKKGIECFNACPDPDPSNTCHNKCITDNPDPSGSTKFTDLVTCLSSKCKTPCLPG